MLGWNARGLPVGEGRGSEAAEEGRAKGLVLFGSMCCGTVFPMFPAEEALLLTIWLDAEVIGPGEAKEGDPVCATRLDTNPPC